MRNPPSYYKYYDKIYSRKDYHFDVETVLRIFAKNRKSRPRTVLDVGCGTGSHIFEFLKRGIEVTGTDIDLEMIKVARSKSIRRGMPRPDFFCGEIGQLKAKSFDLAVSLFNVVNYISDFKQLLNFFSAINRRLKRRGMFIFDAWNGVAAILDPPRRKVTSLALGREGIKIITKPEKLDLFHQTVLMQNNVSIAGRRKSFRFSYTQNIWTPRQLTDALELTDFRVLTISPRNRPDAKASYKSWKILLVCLKK